MSLSARTAAAGRWQIASVASQALAQLAAIAVLARLVGPEEYGVVAVASIAIAFGSLISDAGIAPALVQRTDLTREHIGAAFSASLLFGLLLSGAVWFIAPATAQFFDTPSVTPLLRLYCWTFVLTGGGNVAVSLLERRLDFRSVTTADVASYVGGYVPIAIVLALHGYGAAALIGGQLTQAFLRTAIAYGIVRHPVTPFFAPGALKDLLRFGTGNTLMRVLNVAANRIDYVIAGRMLGMGALGLYERAFRMMDIPGTLVGNAVARVLFPAMSTIQTDRARLAKAYFLGLGLVQLLLIPVTVLLLVIAPELVVVVLGSEWTDVIGPLRILLIAAAFRTGTRLTDNLARSAGAVYASSVRKSVFALAVAGLGFIGSARFGVTGIALGVALANVVDYGMMGRLANLLLNRGWIDHARALASPVLFGLVTALASLPLSIVLRSLSSSPVLIVIVVSIAGGITILVLSAMMPRAIGPAGRWAFARMRARGVRGPYKDASNLRDFAA